MSPVELILAMAAVFATALFILFALAWRSSERARCWQADQIVELHKRLERKWNCEEIWSARAFERAATVNGILGAVQQEAVMKEPCPKAEGDQ